MTAYILDKIITKIERHEPTSPLYYMSLVTVFRLQEAGIVDGSPELYDDAALLSVPGFGKRSLQYMREARASAAHRVDEG